MLRTHRQDNSLSEESRRVCKDVLVGVLNSAGRMSLNDCCGPANAVSGTASSTVKAAKND
jgi:hypothetical protein